jgi:hypothetical protein
MTGVRSMLHVRRVACCPHIWLPSAHRTYGAFAVVYQILLVVFMSQAGPTRARPHLHRDRARHRRFRLTPLGSPRSDAVSRSAWYSAASEIVL